MEVRIKHMRDGRHGIPEYKTEGSAGCDLQAYIDEDGVNHIDLLPGERTLIWSGVAMAIPVGFELQVCPRSGKAYKQGLTVLNSPGVIDSDYRGEIGVILINHGHTIITIMDGEPIAQGVVCPVYQADFKVVDELDDTERGGGGFGHTDNK